jgi:L-fucose/D-arabinose isomerase
MARIALATASDGRDFVHEEVGPFGLDVQDRLAAALRERGHEVLTGEGDLSSNADAVRLGRELAAARPDLTLINYPVWAFPHFSLLFASQGSGPLALFSNIDPQYPGMVGMLAAGGGLTRWAASTAGPGATRPTRRSSTGSAGWPRRPA